MGWDAEAYRADGKGIDIDWRSHREGTEPQIKDPKLKAVFESAAEAACDETGSVDGLLRLGGLDVSTCGAALASATGRSVYDEDGWLPEDVKSLAASAEWPEPIGEMAWAVVSARKFLETCAAHNLGIRFSW